MINANEHIISPAVEPAPADPLPAQPAVAVVIPAYRPGPDLKELTDILLARRHRVIVVNDGSESEFDPVFEALHPSITLLRHQENLGKGCALKTGIAYAVRNLQTCAGVVTADADGQHRPEDIARVAARLLDTAAAPDAPLTEGDGQPAAARPLILGSRQFEGNVPLRSRFGNTLTRYVFAAATGVKLTDTQTGLRAFDLALASQLLTVPGNRFEYELNVLLWATRQHVPIEEVVIRTVYIAGNATSHFNPIVDSIRIYSCILTFTLSSLTAFAIDYALVLALRALTAGLAPGVSLLMSAVGARVVSSAFNFLVNRRLVFQSDTGLLTGALGYYTLAVFILGANYLLLYALNVVAGVPLWLAKLIVEVTLFVASYLVQKKIIFRHRAPAPTVAPRT